MKINELIQHLRGCEGFRCRDCELKDEEVCNPILMEIAASVIEKLQKNNIKLHAFNDMNLGAREMLFEQIAELQKPQWISVKERLPEENERVIVYSAVFDNSYMTRFSEGKFVFMENFECTHWMPSPEPPKDGGT